MLFNNTALTSSVTPETKSKAHKISDRFPDFFKPEIGCYKSLKASIHLKQQAQPSFSKPCDVPYSSQEATKCELDRLVAEGVFERAYFSNWETPTVAVSKQSRKFQICGNYTQLNQCVMVDKHPFPKLDNLMRKLRGGTFFAKIAR